jgi:PAS domain S-box-containing protein
VNGRNSRTESGYDAVDILDASQDRVWILKPDGVIEHMNRHAKAMVPAAAINETNWRRIWPEESRFSLDRALAAAAAGQVATFRAFLGASQGSRTYCDTTISPVRDGDGAIIRLLATARDVTREVETHAFLKTVIQMLPTPLTVKNVWDGCYVLTNRAAEDAFGLGEEALGQAADALLPPASAARLALEEAKVLRTGEMQVSEHEVEAEAGPRHFQTKILATYDDMGPRHLITLSDDVTAQRSAAAALRVALDEAKQASHAKSAFLANMSHEIRTPLNGIVAGADLLAKLDLDPRARELAAIILTSGKSLERLLSEVLDLARIEAGQVVIELGAFHLGDLARSVSALCALRAEEKGVVVEVMIAPSAEVAVTGDEARMRQVLTNLVSNAVKFTDHGRVTVEVALGADDLARLSVRDTGIGFDLAQKERIFGRFQQADTSFTRRFGGTGLGLAISRELIELMGGTLSCDSLPGVGSSFWFDLSLPVAETAPATAPIEAAAETPAGVPRILVADDHPTNRKIVELMLADFAEIFTAEDGRQAVELFEMVEPDLILMDMQMPVMDGLAAVREIRARETAGGGARVPIIMLTANARPEHIRASQDAGADLHLEKPITSATLMAAIARVSEASDDVGQDVAAEA